jgi:hypothetical protein
MIKGHCLCGGIRYEYDGEITELAICHCNQCKRAQGTPFVTNAPISFARFSVTSGSELIKEFKASENKRRTFCATCGSPLYSQRLDTPETIRLRVGTISEGAIPKPDYHIHYASKSEWFDQDEFQTRYPAEKSD